MASFDIITAAGLAYRLTWTERHYLLRLAAVPMVVKLVCHGTMQVLGFETMFVRQALLMLPSYLFDGWLLAHVIRLVFYGQRWPFRPGGANDMAVFRDRAQGIMTGAVSYALTRFLMTGLFAAVYASASTAGLHDAAGPASPPEGRPGAMIAVMLLMAGMIWSFRLFWFYIPAAANIPFFWFMKRLRGLGSSFYMLGAWLVCFLPVLFLFIAATSLLAQPFAGQNGLEIPLVLNAVFSLLWVATDTVIEILTTFALAIGLKTILMPERPKA